MSIPLIWDITILVSQVKTIQNMFFNNDWSDNVDNRTMSQVYKAFMVDLDTEWLSSYF